MMVTNRKGDLTFLTTIHEEITSKPKDKKTYITDRQISRFYP